MSDWTAAPHVIEVEHFRRLATGTDDHDAVTVLWRTERSWRMSVLRMFLDTFTERDGATGPLVPVEQAWQLIIDADRAGHNAVEEVLARPTIGLWAVYTLRQAGKRRTTETPLWAEVGYLHSIAAACAIRSQLQFELEVPVLYGTVTLPTVGAAALPDGSSTAWVRAGQDRVTVTAAGVTVTVGAGDPAWHPPIVIEVAVGEARLEVELLDRDPYRDMREPAAPLALTAEQIEKWRDDLGAAWAILAREQPGRALSVAAALRALAPLPAREPYRPLSASGAEAFGGILLSAPDDPAQLAMTLVHESQHNKLGALLHLITMVSSDRSLRYYAPWRDDPRPLVGLLQGAYAFSGIIDFWRVHRLYAAGGDASLAYFEFALWRRQTQSVLLTLQRSGRLTGYGKEFVARMNDRMAAAQTEWVPDIELTAAVRMADDHRAMWRAHNVRLDPVTEDLLVGAWENGDRLPSEIFAGDGPPLTVVAAPEPGWFDTRAVLTRRRFVDPVASPMPVQGSTKPDFALIAGEYAAARAGYLKALTREPANAHHWIGYALALDDWMGSVMLRRPEILLAVARRQQAKSPDPVRLAAWVADGLPAHALRIPDPSSWRVA